MNKKSWRTILNLGLSFLNALVVLPLWLGIAILSDLFEGMEYYYLLEKEGIVSFTYVPMSRIFFLIWIILVFVQVFVFTFVFLNYYWPKRK